MSFELPKLPYSHEALEPVISKKTIEFHHGKHHQAYVNKLNGLVKGTDFETVTLEDIILNADGGIFNNGAQVWNHTFYFESFSPDGPRKPVGKVWEAIKESFGSFDAFKEKFSDAGGSLFGSGWVWLVKTGDQKIDIVKESNAGNPLRKNLQPLLTCDVWEHAYYLDYQNRRPDYLKEFWSILDWDVINKRFEA